MIRALTRFLSLPAAEQGRTVEAAFCLLVVRVAFGPLPFRWALKLLGVSRGGAGSGRVAAAEARQVGRAIARAARNVPFRAVCLQQSFAALLMLRRRGLAATVHLGVAREEGGEVLTAHAWSHCGDVPVTGVAVARTFAPVVVFAA